MKRYPHSLWTALCITTLVTGLAPAEITQADGADYLAFEAENFSECQTDTFINSKRGDKTYTVMWQKLPSEAASGGSCVQAVIGAKVPQKETNNATLTYKPTFKTPGKYFIYARIRATQLFAKSMFYATGFSEDPQQTEYCYLGTKNTSEDFQWLPGNPYINSFKIDEKDQTVSFHLKVREQEFEVDRIIFSLNKNLQTADLDQLSNSPTGD